jgi:hypothetical protein
MIVVNHAPGTAEIMSACWARKSRPVMTSVMTNSQKAGRRRCQNDVW